MRRILIVAFVCIQLAKAEEYVLPPEDIGVVGQTETEQAAHEDTLSDIARRHGLGFDQIVKANPNVDPWLPGTGTIITLPKRHVLPDAPREGIVINLPEMRIFYYPKPKAGELPKLITYPVSIGRLDWKTPLGLTTVAAKVTNPTWTPPETIRREHAEQGEILPAVVPAGPDNPLGQYALRLGVRGYLIHGTDKAWGIGMRVTHGCMRLYPENIEALFKEVSVGTPVRLVSQPFKVGWLAGILYLQVFQPLEEEEQTLIEQNAAVRLLTKAVEGRPRGSYQIDGEAVRRTIVSRMGLPIPVGREVLAD
ncbi:putative L,D-transpeptidase YcfS [Gammaproteobacteria bacterium]